jgi:hypothetical protein
MHSFSKAGSLLLFLFFILIFHTIAQTARITGQVIDSESRDALAFVTIQFNEGPEGCISDIDGRFTVNSSVHVYKLKIS